MVGRIEQREEGVVMRGHEVDKLVDKAVEATQEFINANLGEFLDKSKTSEYWDGQTVRAFELPNWGVLGSCVNSLVFETGPVQEYLCAVPWPRGLSVMSGPREAQLKVERTIIRVCLAVAYGVLAMDLLAENLTAHLRALIEGKELTDVRIIGLCGIKIKREVCLDDEVSLTPLSPGDIGWFIGALREPVEPHFWLNRSIRPGAPLLRMSVLTNEGADAQDVSSVHEAVTKTNLALGLVCGEPCCFVGPGERAAYDGSPDSMRDAENSRWRRRALSRAQEERVKELWGLFGEVPGLTKDNPNDPLAIAARRYSSCLREGDADAFIDLMIAVEAILGPKSRDDELRFRYSLMTGAAIRPPGPQREEVFQTIRSCYDERSAVVHSGKSKLTGDKRTELLTKGRHVVSELIQAAMTWTASGKSMEKFAEEAKTAAVRGRPFHFEGRNAA